MFNPNSKRNTHTKLTFDERGSRPATIRNMLNPIKSSSSRSIRARDSELTSLLTLYSCRDWCLWMSCLANSFMSVFYGVPSVRVWGVGVCVCTRKK